VDIKPHDQNLDGAEAMLKDDRLDWLAQNKCTIAQFFSLAPNCSRRHSRIRGYPTEYKWSSIKESIEAIFRTQRTPSVNIRTFRINEPDGNPFIYGLKTVEEVETKIRELSAQGYYLIINETIDKDDGGFSGVLFGDVMEVSPFAIPRCVEEDGVMALPREIGLALIQTVYGIDLEIPFDDSHRVEFSVHPTRVGWLGKRQTIWQVDRYSEGIPGAPTIIWPNNFSRAIGDKTFGLLMAHLLGFPVPHTTVIARLIPMFTFGKRTGTGEYWLRTAPAEQTPGKHPTTFGWEDPFEMVGGCELPPDPGLKLGLDLKGNERQKIIASVLRQEHANPSYAGATIIARNGDLITEGKRGFGDTYMAGEEGNEDLPETVLDHVRHRHECLTAIFGDTQFEWVLDDGTLWIIQLHLGSSEISGNIIYPGNPDQWLNIKTSDGIEALRNLISVRKENEGILVNGSIGRTSHWCQLLTKAKIPSRLIRT